MFVLRVRVHADSPFYVRLPPHYKWGMEQFEDLVSVIRSAQVESRQADLSATLHGRDQHGKGRTRLRTKFKTINSATVRVDLVSCQYLLFIQLATRRTITINQLMVKLYNVPHRWRRNSRMLGTSRKALTLTRWRPNRTAQTLNSRPTMVRASSRVAPCPLHLTVAAYSVNSADFGGIYYHHFVLTYRVMMSVVQH